MSVYTQIQTDNLKQMLRVLCQQIIGNVRNVIDALRSLDGELAHSVVKRNHLIVRMELDILQVCKNLLASDKVMPADLQYAISMLRVNVDLERIAKQTVAIAHHIIHLQTDDHDTRQPAQLLEQAAAVTDLVQKAIDSLLALDVHNASAAIALDDTVDDCYGRMVGVWAATSEENNVPDTAMEEYLQIAKELERLADHAVSICRDVIDRSQH